MDELLASDFMTYYGNVPKTLPSSLLVCPPSSTYMKQFTIG
jgi:hypothetical protein